MAPLDGGTSGAKMRLVAIFFEHIPLQYQLACCISWPRNGPRIALPSQSSTSRLTGFYVTRLWMLLIYVSSIKLRELSVTCTYSISILRYIYVYFTNLTLGDLMSVIAECYRKIGIATKIN